MSLFPLPAQAKALAELHRANPFTDERLALEATALGARFTKVPRAFDATQASSPNQSALEELCAELVEAARNKIEKGHALSPADAAIYKELVFLTLFDRVALALDALIDDDKEKPQRAYEETKQSWSRFFDRCSFVLSVDETPARAFALFFQLRRAFHFVHRFLLGSSRPTAALRAAVWRSIFTVDPARYRRALVGRMNEIPTLILGESGTGKELIARAIAHSGFVSYVEHKQAFAGDWRSFFPVSLAALPEALVESALFGHKKGAFTGAVVDVEGLLSACPREGTVFLDEIGELPPLVQVKLLRVLETREVSALGEHGARPFLGRIVAATWRDLDDAVARGTFRGDLLHRLTGDIVVAPPLRARRDDDAHEIPRLTRALCERLVGAAEADALAADVARAVSAVGERYAWPGNVRELAQLVRRVLVQGPDVQRAASSTSVDDAFVRSVQHGTATLDEVIAGYVQRIHAREGSLSATARALQVDRRTVRTRLGQETSNDPGENA